MAVAPIATARPATAKAASVAKIVAAPAARLLPKLPQPLLTAAVGRTARAKSVIARPAVAPIATAKLAIAKAASAVAIVAVLVAPRRLLPSRPSLQEKLN